MVICGSSRRSLENPGSRNPSPASVSKYKRGDVVEHQARRAQPRMSGARRRQRLPEVVLRDTPGRRRLTVGYDGAPTPASSSTRSESSLLVGSMIRASTSCREHLVPAGGDVQTQHAVSRASRRPTGAPSATR